jgi:hypothetical protein
MVDPVSREPVLNLRDETRLHPEGFLLALVGVETGVQVEATALALEVVNELVDGDVILGGIVQIVSEVHDIAILIQPEYWTRDVILAHAMAEPAFRFEFHPG